MATYRDLIKRVEWYVDDKLDDPTALMLFNQAGEDLSPVAGYVQTKEAPFQTDVPTLTLPGDYFDLIELKIKRNSDKGYYRIRPLNLVQPPDFYALDYEGDGEVAGYELVGNTVEIRMPPREQKAEDGTVLMRYYAMLPAVTDLAQSPVIMPIYHDAYALFAAAKWWQNYQDELQAKSDYWGEYLLKRSQLEKEMRRLKEKNKSKSVYVFRSWT